MTTVLHDQPERDAALTDFDNNLVITAGAGTGKTSLLTGRVLSALLAKDIAPAELWITTFTDMAAAEMASRIEAALVSLSIGEPNDDAARAEVVLVRDMGQPNSQLRAKARAILDSGSLPEVSTFHAFCLRCLREFSREAQLSPTADIVERDDEEQLFDEFWLELLDEELSGKKNGILDSKTWRSLAVDPGISDLKEILASYCKLSLAYPLAWEDSFETIKTDIASRLDQKRDLLTRVAPLLKKSYHDNAVPAIEALRAVADLPVSATVPARLIELCSDRSHFRRPTMTNKVTEEDKDELNEFIDWVKKTLKRMPSLCNTQMLTEIRTFCEAADQKFRDKKAKAGILSHQDCLSRCLALVRDNASVLRELRRRYRQILVDEFQDTDPIQYEILFLIASGKTGVQDASCFARSLRPGLLCIVGDPKQSIYRFRGADMEAFDLALQRVLKDGGRQLQLSVNFRSKASVLSCVNLIMQDCIKEAPGIQAAYERLRTAMEVETDEDDNEARVELLHVVSNGSAEERRKREARVLAEHVQAYMAATSEHEYSDVAFLFRAFTNVDIYVRELRQLGIPVLVEGGRRFYERHEVERFIALCELICRPWNEVALLAFLRSPLAGVSDPELLQWTSVSTGFKGFWTDDLKDCPSVREARDVLQRLRDDTARLAPTEALHHVLHDSGLAALEAAGYDGAQRLANVEKLITLVAERSTLRHESLPQVVERLTSAASELEDMSESPLADPEQNAVRLLTVHKAKGLEFEVVYLPDMARQKSPDRSKSRLLFAYRNKEGVEILLHDWAGRQAYSIDIARERRRQHESAEDLRVLYVAMTRAKRSLHLCLTPSLDTSAKMPWATPLRSTGFDISKPPEEDVCLLDGPLRYRRITKLAAATVARTAERNDEERLVRAVERWHAARKTASAAIGPRVAAPSAHAEDEYRGSAPASTGASGQDPALARAVGNVVHAYLQAMDFASCELDMKQIEAMSAQQERLANRVDVAREAAVVLGSFLDSELRRRLAQVEILAREAPILYRDNKGQPWHGAIDILFREDGEIVIADYKTDRIEAGELEQRAQFYTTQITHYARAVQLAWQLDGLPHREVLFVRLGLAQRLG